MDVPPQPRDVRRSWPGDIELEDRGRLVGPWRPRPVEMVDLEMGHVALLYAGWPVASVVRREQAAEVHGCTAVQRRCGDRDQPEADDSRHNFNRRGHVQIVARLSNMPRRASVVGHAMSGPPGDPAYNPGYADLPRPRRHDPAAAGGAGRDAAVPDRGIWQPELVAQLRSGRSRGPR